MNLVKLLFGNNIMNENKLNYLAGTLRKAARPVAFILIVITLCLMGLIDQCVGKAAPKWFTFPLVAYVIEWTIERVWLKKKLKPENQNERI